MDLVTMRGETHCLYLLPLDESDSLSSIVKEKDEGTGSLSMPVMEIILSDTMLAVAVNLLSC